MTEVTLKEHLERVLTERDQRYEQRFKAQETAAAMALVATKNALTIALAAVEKGNAAAIEANKVLAAKAEEFADQKLQTHNSIKPWVQAKMDAQDAKVDALERRVARFENREEGVGWTTKLVVGALGVLATLVSLYFALR